MKRTRSSSESSNSSENKRKGFTDRAISGDSTPEGHPRLAAKIPKLIPDSEEDVLASPVDSPKLSTDPSPAENINAKNESKPAKLETVKIGQKRKADDTGERKEGKQNPAKTGPKTTFPHGNYLRYYGYRNKGETSFKDPRVDALGAYKNKYFCGKDVLDIGCNSGQVTLLVAKKYRPRKIVGCDIDETLIKIARKNIVHYLKNVSDSDEDRDLVPPASFLATHGPIEAPVVHCANPDGTFPNNVLFFSGDFVPKTDHQVTEQTPEYDTILALSLSKWIHMNGGDEGLLRFFQRSFNALRKDGYFVLEPQPWTSYKKKQRQLPPHLRENVGKLKLRPEQFESILLDNIGFRKVTPLEPRISKKNKKTNFGQRPLLVFKK